MPIRVEPISYDPLGGPIVQPIIEKFSNALGPMQQTLNGVAGLGGSIQDTLGKTTALVDGIAVNPGAILEPNVSIKLDNLGQGLNKVIQVSPPIAVPAVQGIVQDVKNIKSNATSVFNSAKERVSSTKGLISLALIGVCMMFGSVIQDFIADMFAKALRIERAIRSFIEGIKKAIVNAIKKALEEVMKVLPDCSPFMKDVAKAFKSVLNKASQVVAKLNDFLRKVSDCAAMADGTMALLDFLPSGGSGSSSIGTSFPTSIGTFVPSSGMTGIVEKSRDLSAFDAIVMKERFIEGVLDTSLDLDNLRISNDTNTMFWDATTGQLQEIEKATDEVIKELEELIKDADENGYTDSYKDYRDFLEQAKKDAEDLKESIKDAAGEGEEKGLYEKTEEIVDEMIDKTIKDLEDLKDELVEKTDKAAEEIDDIFEKLENLAEEFDSPEVQEQLVTACMDTEVRVVVN